MLLLPRDADVVVTIAGATPAAGASSGPTGSSGGASAAPRAAAAAASGSAVVGDLAKARYCKKCAAVFEQLTPETKCPGSHVRFSFTFCAPFARVLLSFVLSLCPQSLAFCSVSAHRFAHFSVCPKLLPSGELHVHQEDTGWYNHLGGW